MATSDNFQRMLLPGLRKIFFETYNEISPQFEKVFNVGTSNQAVEEDHHVSGLGMWEEKKRSENIKYEDIEDGLSIFYKHTAFAKGIQIERELIDDEKYSVINKMPKTLARGGRALVETTAADLLNNAFSANGYDGVPMFSDSHPLIKGGTGDNIFDAPLNEDGIEEGILLMRSTTDEAGLKIQSRPDRLIIAPDLEWTAIRLLESTQQPGTANNDVNVAKSRVSPVVMDYLTSATAWFLQDSKMHEMNFFWRVKPEFKDHEEFDNMVAKYRGYLRFSVGYSNWRGIVGSDGTGAP